MSLFFMQVKETLGFESIVAFFTAKDRILCFNFSLNPLKFSHMRETNTKMTSAKS
jgi:hypothetical protein